MVRRRQLRGRVVGFPPAAVMLTVGAAMAASGPAVAGEWDFEPRIRVAQTYTDNVGLTENNTESEHVTEVTPGFSLSGEGRRATLDVEYRAQGLFFIDDSDRNDVFHQLGADGSLELVRNTLFLDADASQTQDLISADRAQPGSNIFTSGNRGDVSEYGFGPRLRYAFGSFAGLRASYRHSEVDFDSSDFDPASVESSTTDTASVSLSSGPRFDVVGWALNYQHTEEDPETQGVDEEDRTFESASVELNLALGARTQVFAVGGEENNEFENAAGDDDAIDGSFWEAGIRWGYGNRVDVELAVGERFFGDTARASVDLQGRALSLELGYQENLVTNSSLQTERNFLRDQNGNIILDPQSGDPLLFFVPTLRNEVILEERATARLAYDYGHSLVALSFVATDREFQLTGGTEETTGVDLSWTWTRLPLTTVEIGGGVFRQEFATSDREDDLATARLLVSRDINEELVLSLDYEISVRDSNQDGEDFDAQRITVALEKVF